MNEGLEGSNKQRFLHVVYKYSWTGTCVWIEIYIIIVGQVTRENNKYKTGNKLNISYSKNRRQNYICITSFLRVCIYFFEIVFSIYIIHICFCFILDNVVFKYS